MGDVLTFTNPKWIRLPPITVQPWEVCCLVIFDWLEQEVPRHETLSVFEHKWLDRIVGYRNREVFNYLADTREFWDGQITESLYGNMPRYNERP